MLTLAATQTIAGVASAATEVTCTLFLMQLNAGVEVYTNDQQQLATSAATIYTAPASTEAFVRSIHVVNTDTSNSNTFQLFVGGTAAANAITPVFTLLPGGMAVYEDGLGWQFFDNTGRLMHSEALSTAFTGGTLTTVNLASNATANSTTTGVEITGLNTTLTAGTYIFEYFILYESAATTTGVSFGVNYTGTETVLVGWMEYPGTGTTASTGAASMVASGATGQVHESFGFRAASTTAPNMGATVSVDAANSVMMCHLNGILIAADGGDLELWHASEVAASSTVRAGTTLRLYKVA